MIANAEKKVVRCAIYTRKSNEDGLEQAFNSLHAQRAMCESYIASYASEGWTVVRANYSDAGITGGDGAPRPAEASDRHRRRARGCRGHLPAGQGRGHCVTS